MTPRQTIQLIQLQFEILTGI